MYKRIMQDQEKLVKAIKAAGLNRVIIPIQEGRKKASVEGEPADSEAIKYAQTCTKRNPNNEILVVVGCSSWEYYGPNSNGDGFPSEKAYPNYGITESDLLTKHYKTFEKAQLFYMHDMTNAIGWVLKAFWNNAYKWVEIVIEVDASRADTFVMDKLREGETVFVSMGCVVAYDVCTVCGHKSIGSKYCVHIKNNLLDIIDDVIAAMLNPSPKFDDISIVFIPADAIATAIYRKAASAVSGDRYIKVASCNRKKPAMAKSLKKIADIYKNTSVLKSIKNFKDNYPELSTKYSSDKFEDLPAAIAYYFSNSIPMPVLALAEQFGIKESDLIKVQEDIIVQMIKDDSIRDRMDSIIKSGDITQVKGIAEKLEDKGEVSALAYFNILNKLKLEEDGVDSAVLPKDSPSVTEIERIIELEFLK